MTALVMGRVHTCAIDSTSSIECWGVDDDEPSLDYGQVTDVPPGSGYTSVSAGGYHNCAINAVGGIECWGTDYYGQVSDAP